MNVIDGPGKISYTRKKIESNKAGEFSLDSRERELNFIGNRRPKYNYIPGYVFKIYKEFDVQNLAQVLTKCFFEVTNQKEFEKAVENEDTLFL